MSSRSIVGLEIAEGWVRGVELTKPGSRRPVVRAVAEVSLPEGAARDSEVLDRDAVAVALTQLWAQGGFKTKDVILGVGNRRILVREHVAPALPLDQIRQALKFQVQDMLPVPVDQAVLDFYPVEPTTAADGQPGVAGLLVSAVSENIEGLLAAVTAAKLRVVGVDLAPFGLARAAARVAAPGVRSLVAHIGSGTSWFVVLEDAVPRFVRIVPAGIPAAGSTTPAGSHELVVPQEVPAPVEAAVASVSPFPGFAPQPDQGPGDAGAPEDPVEELLTWFDGTRDFYERGHPDKPLQQVLITGEGAMHPELLDRLRATSAVEVEAFGISDAFDSSATEAGTRRDLAALTTAGVALGGEV